MGSTHYTYEGSCYTKTTLAGCAANSQAYNSVLKEHCTSCSAGYLLDTGKCYFKIAACKTNTVTNGVIGCTECEAKHLLSKNKCYGHLTGCLKHIETPPNYTTIKCTQCVSTKWILKDDKCHKLLTGCAY